VASLNKVYLIGNLTRDPDLRYTNSGAGVCNMGLATSRKYTTASGEQREDTCFVDIDVWGKQAEACRNYLHRGSPVFVEGRLRLDQWDDQQSGRKTSRLRVTAERVQFISSRPQGTPPQTQGLEAPQTQGFEAPQTQGFQAPQAHGGYPPQQVAPQQQAAPQPLAPQQPSYAPAPQPQAAPPPPFPADNSPIPAAAPPPSGPPPSDESIDDIPF
jgi:single-strand DNA-binding protein